MDEAKKNLIQTLSKWQVDLKKFKPTPPFLFRINSSNFHNASQVADFLTKIKAIEGPCIYRILISNKKYCAAIRQSFENFQIENKPKEKGIKRHVSRIMAKESETLYVGSKRNKIEKRIEQHLGYGNARTYSLDLKFWFPEKIEILIEVYSVKLNDDLLVALEQSMWSNSTPMFGKKSGL